MGPEAGCRASATTLGQVGKLLYPIGCRLGRNNESRLGILDKIIHRAGKGKSRNNVQETKPDLERRGMKEFREIFRVVVDFACFHSTHGDGADFSVRSFGGHLH